MHRAIQNKRLGILTSIIVFLHDNARSAYSCLLLSSAEAFQLGIVLHPPYNPDLASSDYYMFTYLKKGLESQCFNNNQLMEGVKTWLISHAAGFFDTSIQILIPRYNRGLNSGNDYIEK
jgi:hypothetical protein